MTEVKIVLQTVFKEPKMVRKIYSLHLYHRLPIIFLSPETIDTLLGVLSTWRVPNLAQKPNSNEISVCYKPE